MTEIIDRKSTNGYSVEEVMEMMFEPTMEWKEYYY